MFCIKCGKENHGESKFCYYCGAEMPQSQPVGNNILGTNNNSGQGGNVIHHNQEKGFYIVNWIITFIIGLLFFAFPMLTEYTTGAEYYLHIYHVPGVVSYISDRVGMNLEGGGMFMFFTVSIMLAAVVIAISLIILYKNMINYDVKKIVRWSKIYATISLIALVMLFIWDKVGDNYSDAADDFVFHKYKEMAWFNHYDMTAFFWVAVVVAVAYRFLILTMYTKVIKNNISGVNTNGSTNQ